MRRPLAALALIPIVAVALTGCLIAPPGSGPSGYALEPAPSDDFGYSDEDFSVADQDHWQAESRAWELDFAEYVAGELRALDSALPPPEGESLETFRHVIIGVGYEWCDRIFADESRMGDTAEYSEGAARYDWTVDEYRIVVESAQVELCGY